MRAQVVKERDEHRAMLKAAKLKEKEKRKGIKGWMAKQLQKSLRKFKRSQQAAQSQSQQPEDDSEEEAPITTSEESDNE